MKNQSIIFNSILILSLFFLLAGFRMPLLEGDVYITTTADEFDSVTPNAYCSVREAVQATNLGGAFGGCFVSADWTVVNFQFVPLPTSIYTITRANPGSGDDNNEYGDFDLLPRTGLTVNIHGTPYVTELNGGGLDRIFDVKAASGSLVSIDGIRITNGHTLIAGGGIFNSGTLELNNVRVDNSIAQHLGLNNVGGGAIFNNGTMTITLALLDNNSNDPVTTPGNSAAWGGAIFNLGTLSIDQTSIIFNNAGDFDIPGNSGIGGYGGAITSMNGTVLINHSTIAYNRSGDCLQASNCSGGGGGGIFIYAGTTTIQNSTISNNLTGDSLGISDAHGGGIYNYGTLNLYDSTVAYNAITSDSLFNSGGGIYNSSEATASLRNSILSNNDSRNYGMECAGDFLTLDYNLIFQKDIYCNLEEGSAPHDLLNEDAHLYPLGFSGGSVYLEVHFPRWDSPAIDQGIPAPDCPDDDERGFTRPIDGDFDGTPACDIGAVESDWAQITFLPVIRK